MLRPGCPLHSLSCPGNATREGKPEGRPGHSVPGPPTPQIRLTPSPKLSRGPSQSPGGADPFPHAARPALPTPSGTQALSLLRGVGALHPAAPMVRPPEAPGRGREALRPPPEPCVLGVCRGCCVPGLIHWVTPGGRHFLSAPFPGDPPRQPLNPRAAPGTRVAAWCRGPVLSHSPASRSRHLQLCGWGLVRLRVGVRLSRAAFLQAKCPSGPGCDLRSCLL